MGFSSTMNLQSWPITVSKWSAMTIIAFWATLPKTLPMLMVFMGLDILTGIIAAFVKKELDSKVSFRGMAKKSLIILLVITIHLASKWVGAEVGFSYDLGSLVAIAYIVNEVISITENCSRAGVPVPKILMDALAKAKGVEWTPSSPDRRIQGRVTSYIGPERRESTDGNPTPGSK